MIDIQKQNKAYWAAVCSLLLLIVLCLAWELWLAPLRSGGSWLALKALPLCLPLVGILNRKIYTFQWACLLILAYFAEAVMRLFDVDAVSRACAAAAVVFSVVFFAACLRFVQLAKQGAKNGH
ncbi:MAG: DUF2069 domain-containing protein [Neisseria sp.]|nr:DUF2069 domain-containing protein [Neisseria sp.]